MMRVYELIIPGTRMETGDPELHYKLWPLFNSLQSSYCDANIALNLFEQSMQINIEDIRGAGNQEDIDRFREIQNSVEAQLKKNSAPIDIGEVMFQASRIFYREKWQSGPPQDFKRRYLFIYAKLFLYSLDSYERILAVFSSEAQPLVDLSKIHNDLVSYFSDLRGVRNTSHHHEDRLRGLGSNSKPLDLKPIDNQAIKADNGALILDNLIDSKYGSTMADGYYGEVDVSHKSMLFLQNNFSQLIQSFRWSGMKQAFPNC